MGETFEAGRSVYDFSERAIRDSVSGSLDRLRTDVLDLVFIHSNGDDVTILNETDAVESLRQLKAAGLIKAIGLSGKTAEGARLALDWADAGVLLLPCGRSAHLELGYLIGQGKPTSILLTDGEPELMYSLASRLCCDTNELLEWSGVPSQNLIAAVETAEGVGDGEGIPNRQHEVDAGRRLP